MTDFDINQNIDDVLGLEKMLYTAFYTAFVVRRPTQAPNKFDSFDKLRLPNNSVLHTLNGFDTLVPPNDGMPSTDLPILQNEKFPIYLKLQTTPVGEGSGVFGIKDSYTYRPNTLMPAISYFYQHHRRFHRVLSDRTLASMAGVLTWIDYSPLNEMKVNGTLHAYRKFDYLFRTILDQVVRIGAGKHHYILLPQGNHVFGRSVMLRAFRELSTGTLNRLAVDPSIFPALHLLGFVYGKTHDLKVSPYRRDVAEFPDAKSTSLLERIPASMYDAINFVMYRDNKAVIYRLSDLIGFSEDPSFYVKFYRHIMNLRVSEAALPQHVDPDSDQFDTLMHTMGGGDDDAESPVVETPVVEKEKPAEKKAVEEVKPTPKVDLTPVTKKEKTLLDETEITKPISFEEKIRTAATLHHPVNAAPNDPKVISKRDQLVDNHLKVVINGKPLGELIQNPPAQAITPKQMDFVKSAPEASYKSSTLIAMDRAYHEHVYHHDMAKVVGSLAKHGMYATKIDEERTHTEMDRTVTYKVSLTDVNGKAHNVRFTVPDIDSNGLMRLGGIEYRLTRQIANVPICKISPLRVNLSSYYNKVLVERIQSKRNNYELDIQKLIMSLRDAGYLEAVAGASPNPTKAIAYDYTAIGRSFTEITVSGYHFYFDGDGAGLEHANFEAQEKLPDFIDQFGAFVGDTKSSNLLFWDIQNQIHEVDRKGTLVTSWRSFHHFLLDHVGEAAIPTKQTIEWTQVKLLNKVIPLVFVLGYKFGLKNVLDMIKLDYRFYQTGVRPQVDTMDISIKFSDGTLVFNRYPLARSLVAAGLAWVDLKDVAFRDLSIPDTYARVFQKKDMTVGVLKGIRNFYDFFVDPITESVLVKMHEPITFHELLLRANVMLTDYAADESSSVKLHRFRHAERLNGIIYNEIYRALADYRGNPSTRSGFSINPEAVFLQFIQDATVTPNDAINPVHEVKQIANFSFTGSGGRTANSFVLKDRIYPKDGLGVISESVPDSGKVGITAYLSAAPKIHDVHGIPQAYKEGDQLEPPQVLSIGSMVMPGGTMDDGKRNNYLSIQISHYVPNHHDGETLAVRTGYDEVLPHLTSDLFAAPATDNGVVEAIDEKQKVVRVRYASKPMPTLRQLRVPYIDHVLHQFLVSNKIFGFLIPDTEIANYPMGGVFSLSKLVNGKVVDQLRCATVDAIPDKDAARRQNSLIQELNRGRHKALYYIRLQPLGTTIPGVVKSYSYNDVYSPISGSYLLQKRIPNVKVGEHFKEGDILVYNPGFFVPDPMSKQVTFKHGVTAMVALVESGSNHEDACEITRSLSSRLKMTPCHQREIVTTRDALVLSIVKVGDHVETPDSLCVISDEFLVGPVNQNVENLDIMEKLSRQTPPADYTGTIRKIRILYGCDREKLSESLKTILKVYEKEVREEFKANNTDPHRKPPEKPGWVAPGTKYHGVDFTEDTVILEFMIEETLDVLEGDKVCFANANKSIAAYVTEKPHFTESGIEVDALFSTTSIINRIVKSPFNGIAERNLDEAKRQFLEMYFEEG